MTVIKSDKDIGQATIPASSTPEMKGRVLIEQAEVVVTEGPHEGLCVSLDSALIGVGRTAWSDIALTGDLQVSAEHCELRIGENGLLVRDLGSKNGVYLDGHRLIEGYWSAGAILQVGESRLELRSTDEKRSVEIDFVDSTGLLVGKSPSMRKIFCVLSRLGKRDVPVLLRGETGTGKTSVAEALHHQSTRCDGPFTVVNCSALPPSLIESALFGHEKGSFTGAHSAQAGYFEQANSGTIFLDEIGELPLEMQPKLLTVLEGNSVQRLGGTKKIKTDFRLITATNRDLVKEVEAGRFREDLYYRISAVPLEVPPLRERKEDIPLLLLKILEKLSPGNPVKWTDSVAEKLQSYVWPGNIRELKNVLEHSLVFLEGPLLTADDIVLPTIHDELSNLSLGDDAGLSPEDTELVVRFGNQEGRTFKQTMQQLEKILLENALNENEWDVAKTAIDLDMSVPWVYRGIKKFGLKGYR